MLSLFKLLVMLMTRPPIQRCCASVSGMPYGFFLFANKVRPSTKSEFSSTWMKVFLIWIRSESTDPKFTSRPSAAKQMRLLMLTARHMRLLMLTYTIYKFTHCSQWSQTVILIRCGFILISQSFFLSVKTPMLRAATTWSIYSITQLCQYFVVRICWISLANLMQGCICRAGCVNFGSSCGLFRASPCQACARF